MSSIKEDIVEGLKALIEYIEKESVSVKHHKMNLRNGYVEGVDRDNLSFKTTHLNGRTNIVIYMDLYNKELDDSANAYDPMVDLFKHINLSEYEQ